MDTVALKPLHSLLFAFLWHAPRLQMIPTFNIYLYEVCHGFLIQKITICPPVRGNNPRNLASKLSSAQADKPWYSYFIPPLSV